MGQEGVTIIENPPEVLAAPPHIDHPSTGHRGLEIGPTGEMAANGPIGAHGDLRDLAADRMFAQPPAYHFDLG